MLFTGTQALASPGQRPGRPLAEGALRRPFPTTGLAVWLDADDGIGVYNDGDAITGFHNRGTAGDFVLAGAGAAPQWKSGLFGGKACLSYSGAGKVIVTPSGMTMGSYAVFVVGYLSSNQTLHCVYQFTDGVAITNLFAYGTPIIDIIKPAGESTYGVTGSPVNKDLRKLWRHVFVDTHASHQLYENGGLVALPSGIAGNPGTAVSAAGVFTVGSNAGVSNKMQGYVRRLLAYSPIPSAADIATIEAYLTAEGTLQ